MFLRLFTHDLLQTHYQNTRLIFASSIIYVKQYS